MKTATSLLALAWLVTATAPAQEKSSSSDRPLQLAPAPAPSGADLLIPDALPQNPKPRGSAIPQPSSMPSTSSRSSSRGSSEASIKVPPVNKTAMAEDAVKQRVAYRVAKNKAVRDPAVQAAWAEAESARTDLEKREALKRYYTLLNARIRKIDGSISKVAVERETLATRRLEQTRIDPTEPLDPGDRSLRPRRD